MDFRSRDSGHSLDSRALDSTLMLQLWDSVLDSGSMALDYGPDSRNN